MSDLGERLERRRAFDGRIFAVDIDRVRMPGGREVTLEIVRHPRSVVLVPMADAERVVLVRQYRYAIDEWIWELPAGTVEPGEAPEEAARREAHEEIGQLPGRLERLGSLYPTPGYCDEEMIFFRLSALETPPAQAARDEDEILEPGTFALSEVRAMIARGEIADMKTVAGILMLEGRRPA